MTTEKGQTVSVGSTGGLGHWRGKPLSQTAAAIKARAQRAAYAEKIRLEKAALEKAALERAKAKLTEEEWSAVENHFADQYCY